MSGGPSLAGERANVRATDARRAYLEAHVFELLIAALAVISALAFFASPGELERTAIGRAVHPFDYAWNALYLVGGALISVGLWRPSYRLESAGLLMFAGAIAGAAAALLALGRAPGVGLATLTASLAISVAAAGACIVRVATIQRVEDAVRHANAELAAAQAPRRRREDRA